jgi:hypothetical protein
MRHARADNARGVRCTLDGADTTTDTCDEAKTQTAPWTEKQQKTGEAVTAVTRKPRFDPKGLSLVLRRSPRGSRIVCNDGELFAGRTQRWADGHRPVVSAVFEYLGLRDLGDSPCAFTLFRDLTQGDLMAMAVLGYAMLVEIPPVVFDCDLPLKNPRDDRESFTGPDGIKKQQAAIQKKEQLMLAWRRRVLDHAIIHLPKVDPPCPQP